MNEEQLMKEIIKEQTQKIINLEQYLRIEKEVSDETIKELEQQSKELKELLDDSEQRRKDLMFSLRNVLDRKKNWSSRTRN